MVEIIGNIDTQIRSVSKEPAQYSHFRCTCGRRSNLAEWGCSGGRGPAPLNPLAMAIGLLGGLALFLYGMQAMGEAMAPLRMHAGFVELMQSMERPILGILVGALFTALVQSSSATIGLVVVMATQGFVTLPAGIAIVFGAKIGTCVTALLAALGKNEDALRAIVNKNERAAQEVVSRRDELWQLGSELLQQQAARLAQDDPQRLLKHRLQVDLLDKMRRIYGIAERMAISILPRGVLAGELAA